jgi:hypothetical protein
MEPEYVEVEVVSDPVTVLGTKTTTVVMPSVAVGWNVVVEGAVPEYVDVVVVVPAAVVADGTKMIRVPDAVPLGDIVEVEVVDPE